jgi:hypothetical protein
VCAFANYEHELHTGDGCPHHHRFNPVKDTVSKRRKRRKTDHHTLTRRLALLTLGAFSHSVSGPMRSASPDAQGMLAS